MMYFTSSLVSRLINGKKELRDISYKKILCIKLDEIGDLCYSVHVFSMLKKQFPEAEITLLCKPFAVSLTQFDSSLNTVTCDINELKIDFDLIVDLRGNWRTIFFALKIWPKARLDRGTVRWENRKAGKHPHEVLTNLQIVKPIISDENQHTKPELFFEEKALQKVDDFILQNSISHFAILHTGARKSLRKWDKYNQLASYLKEKRGLDILFIGDKNDTKDIEIIQQKIPFKTYDFSGIFNLSEFAALASKATIYIGNESGPLHIAALSGIPVIGLFGPGEPFIFYPWSDKADYVHHVLTCNPCDQINCIHPDNPCIKRITFDEVVEKVNDLLSKNKT